MRDEEVEAEARADAAAGAGEAETAPAEEAAGARKTEAAPAEEAAEAAGAGPEAAAPPAPPPAALGRLYYGTITRASAGTVWFRAGREGELSAPAGAALPDRGSPVRLALRARRLVAPRRSFTGSLAYQPFGQTYTLRAVPNAVSCYELYRSVHRMLHRWVPGFAGRAPPPPPGVRRRVVPPDRPSDAGAPAWFEPGEPVPVFPDEEARTGSLTELDVMRAWGFAVKRQPGITHRGVAADWRTASDAGSLVRPWVGRTAGSHLRRFALPAELAGEADGPAPLKEVRAAGRRALASRLRRASAAEAATPSYAGVGGEVILPNEQLWVDVDPLLTVDADVRGLYSPAEHPSVKSCAAELDRPLSLLRCLDVFSRPEALDGESFCRSCSRPHEGSDDVTLRRFTKRLSLWRLPPVVVVQLKRFQHDRHSHRKLNNLVSFPVDGLDVGPFLAAEPAPQPAPDTFAWRFLGGRAGPAAGSGSPSPSPRSLPRHRPARLFPGRPVGATEASVGGVPLLLSRRHALFDLYAVVHHIGAIGSGHYVAYVRSALDDRWRLYNDSSVREVPVAEVQSASAYLLFYRRRDLASADIDELFPPVPGAEPVDLESLLEQAGGSRCAVM